MNFPFYIARRYLFAKKSQTAVNVLTIVAVVGVSVGTMALVIVLSVYNGFEKLILSLFNSFNPDMEIRLVEGKTFNMEDFPADEIRKLPGVLYLGEILEETALITYRDRQHIATLRGVDENFHHITGLDTMMRDGAFKLREGDREYLALGMGVAIMLNANINDYLNPLNIYIPRRGRVSTVNPMQAFNASSNYASGIFAVQSEYDMEYVIAPISLVRFLTEHNKQVSSVILRIDPTSNIRQLQQEIASVVGNDFIVRNRMQQEEFLYKVMRSEKWVIFFILSFILVIAAFNITGSLTMLVLEKRKDISILWSMGCSIKTLKKIFLFEGLLIGIGGAALGILLGGVVSWLQIRFGLIAIQAEGTFIMDAYPVHINPWDFVLVFFTVSVIGWLVSILPVQKIKTFLMKNQTV
ncbi:MAG: FtsX-like permease family protein [Bacteroidota bacterium]